MAIETKGEEQTIKCDVCGITQTACGPTRGLIFYNVGWAGDYKCNHDNCSRTIRLDKDTLMMKRDDDPEFKIEVAYLEKLIMFNSFVKI